MSLKDVEAKLTAVLKSLSDTPRNTYEVDNLFRLNCERVASAQAFMANMSGDYVDQLRARCMEAQRQAEAKHAAGVAGTAAVDNAFSLDFEMEEAEVANEAEYEKAKGETGGARRPAKKSGAKTKSKKSKSDVAAGAQKEAQPSPSTTNPPAVPSEVAATAADGAAQKPRWRVLERQEDLVSADLPTVLATSGRGTCEPVSNSALARVFFTTEMDWDGVVCRCAVELFRCVVLALTYGEPLSSWAECQAAVKAQRAASGASTQESQAKSAAGGCGGAGSVPAPAAAAQRNGDVPDDDDDDEADGGDSEEDMTLSEQLIADYEQARLAEEEQDRDTSVLPRDVTERLQQRLRGFTDDVWVVLLCHGGYFAGGVFVRGACVIHKAFQRYVVRKKQGGKQSTHAKDGGSYGSIGSQIRAAQEVKWRIDVRDILLEWTPYINAASLILYAAPGPQNRAMLTDFSLLPAVAAVNGAKGVSPIQLKDRRVSRVPITTHRPNFEEVQRIYNVCSHCALLYVAEEEEE